METSVFAVTGDAGKGSDTKGLKELLGVMNYSIYIECCLYDCTYLSKFKW